jgi:hypothetical protein
VLTSPTTLSDSLRRLDEDIGLLPGRRVALLGFRDPNAKRVDENVLAVEASRAWQFADARAGRGGTSSTVLAKLVDAPKIVMLVDVSVALSADSELLVRALHDSNETIRWMNQTESRLPSKQVLYVLAAGARSIDDLPRVLASIDFMQFIKPPA